MHRRTNDDGIDDGIDEAMMMALIRRSNDDGIDEAMMMALMGEASGKNAPNCAKPPPARNRPYITLSMTKFLALIWSHLDKFRSDSRNGGFVHLGPRVCVIHLYISNLFEGRSSEAILRYHREESEKAPSVFRRRFFCSVLG